MAAMVAKVAPLAREAKEVEGEPVVLGWAALKAAVHRVPMD